MYLVRITNDKKMTFQTTSVTFVVRNLTLKILVLPFHGFQMIQSFLIRVLQLEKLSAQRPSLLLGALQLTLRLLILLLPL